MMLPRTARTASILALIVVAGSTAEAQTPAADSPRVPRFEIGGGVSIAPAFSDSRALSAFALLNVTKSIGIELAVQVHSEGSGRTTGFYALGNRYSIGTGSPHLRLFVSAAMVGTFETESSPATTYPVSQTGDTLTYPAIQYSRVDGPLAGAVGGGAHILLTNHLAMDAGTQIWIGPQFEIYEHVVPVVTTLSVTVSFGTVR